MESGIAEKDMIYRSGYIGEYGVNYHRPSTFSLILLGTEYKKLTPANSPVVIRIILVAFGTISTDGKGEGLAKDDLSPETLKHIEIMNNEESVLL